MATLSPMMQQYMRLKEQNPDTLLFFRVGDFYEMFFDDAITTSRELELTLTGKECGLSERAPMCGVPHHAIDTYVSRLVEKGYRVAIGEQMQDPALAKGLVERDIIRIITPGTLTDASVIGERRNNFLCAVCVQGKRVGLSWCDVSTGEFYAQQLPFEEAALRSALLSLNPGEIITADVEQLLPLCPVRPHLYSASAFHWVPEEEGYQKVFRILKSGGAFARFANHPHPDKGRPELTEEIDRLYGEYYNAYHKRSIGKPTPYSEEAARSRAEIAAKYGFTDIRWAMFYRTRTFTAAEYIRLLGTYSDHIAIDEDTRNRFFGGIEAAINRHGGLFTLYDTIDLQLARKP